MMTDKQTQIDIIRVANMLADAARPIALTYFRRGGQQLENKLADGFDPVTIADKAIESKMRDILAQERPDDGILGEEFDPVVGRSGLTWVLDPIDGTRSFISGAPTWGVLIGVDAGQGPVLGIIDQPFTQERYYGGFGQAHLMHHGAKQPLKTRPCAKLGDAVLFSTMPQIGDVAETQAFDRVAAQVKLTRFGIDCYAYALLALGQIDLVIEAGLNAYDIQGPIGVVEGAGGLVTDWQGKPAHGGGQVIAAGCLEVHAQALEILNG